MFVLDISILAFSCHTCMCQRLALVSVLCLPCLVLFSWILLVGAWCWTACLWVCTCVWLSFFLFSFFLSSFLISSSLSFFLSFFIPSFLSFFLYSFLSSFLPFFLSFFIPSFLSFFTPFFLPSFLPPFLSFFLPSFLYLFISFLGCILEIRHLINIEVMCIVTGVPGTNRQYRNNTPSSMEADMLYLQTAGSGGMHSVS